MLPSCIPAKGLQVGKAEALERSRKKRPTQRALVTANRRGYDNTLGFPDGEGRPRSRGRFFPAAPRC